MESSSQVAIFIDNSNVLLVIKILQKSDAYWWCSKYYPKYLFEILSRKREIVYIGFYCTPPPSYLIIGDVADQNRYRLAMKYYGMAAQNKYDTAILDSNDADFVSGTTVIQSLSKKVEVVYFKGFGSMEFRQKCDIPRKAKPNFFRMIDGFDDELDKYIPRTLSLL